MKKIDVGQTIAILANIGVIAGIVFLGIQIRQSTQSQQANTYQVLMAGIASINDKTIDYPRIPQIIRGDFGTLQDLDPDDFFQARSFMFNVLRFGDMAYQQYELGLTSRERLETAVGPLAGNVCEPLFREHWNSVKAGQYPPYREFVDEMAESCD